MIFDKKKEGEKREKRERKRAKSTIYKISFYKLYIIEGTRGYKYYIFLKQ